MSKTMTLKPRISEKAYGTAQATNTYVFEVPSDANRLTVSQAVSTQFDVTVETVNILNVKGKLKRTIRRGGRPTMGKRTDFKKAYVTLKEGDTIAIFAGEDNDDSKKTTKKEKK